MQAHANGSDKPEASLRTGLEDYAVVITGAAGGIGRALVDAFAEQGCALALLARQQHSAMLEQMARREWPAPVACADPDLRDPASVDAAFDDVGARLGRLDACIVNAGIWPEAGVPLHAMHAERIREVIDVNLLGALHTARAFLRRLAETGPRADGRGASLLFIGSSAGRFGEPGHVEYAASKAALRGVVLTLKNEIVALDPNGRVNLLEPGWTVTPMVEAALDDTERLARITATVPLRRPARPVEIARVAVALTAPEVSSHLTGEFVTVTGGMEGRLLWPAVSST